jgi:hypothetical protein
VRDEVCPNSPVASAAYTACVGWARVFRGTDRDRLANRRQAFGKVLIDEGVEFMLAENLIDLKQSEP